MLSSSNSIYFFLEKSSGLELSEQSAVASNGKLFKIKNQGAKVEQHFIALKISTYNFSLVD